MGGRDKLKGMGLDRGRPSRQDLSYSARKKDRPRWRTVRPGSLTVTRNGGAGCRPKKKAWNFFQAF